MNKREKRIRDIKALQARGYQITDSNAVQPNDGSETLKHYCCKTVAAHVMNQVGYRVDSEVKNSETFEHTVYADLIGFGCVGRSPIVVELETDCHEKTRKLNQEKYRVGCIREIYTIDISNIGTDIEEIEAAIRDRLGL